MKCKHIKLIMELIFIFILPLAFILPCIKIENNYVYDNNGNYEEKERTIVFDSPLNLTTYDIVSNRVYNGVKVIYHEFVDENCYTLVNALYNEYDGYFVDIHNFNLIAFNNEYAFNYFNHNEFDLYGYNPLELGDLNWYFLNCVNPLDYEVDDSNNLILIGCMDLYLYLENEADIARRSIEEYYTGEGYLTIYDYKYIEYNSYEEVEELSFIGKIKNIFIDFLDFNDSFLLDLFITYTYLWIMFFIAWHLFYRLFDFVMHIADRERRKE